MGRRPKKVQPPVTEEYVVQQVLAMAKRNWRDDMWWYRTRGSRYSRSGVPDLLFCVRGRLVGIEMKRENGRVSPLQRNCLERIAAAGGLAVVACSLQYVERVLTQAINEEERDHPERIGKVLGKVMYEREFAGSVGRATPTAREEEEPEHGVGGDQVPL